MHRDCPMRLAPEPWRYALLTAERADEGVCVFIAQEAGGLIEFKNGIATVAECPLMTYLIEEYQTRGLQIPLPVLALR
jgi:hypothetical protein